MDVTMPFVTDNQGKRGVTVDLFYSTFRQLLSNIFFCKSSVQFFALQRTKETQSSVRSNPLKYPIITINYLLSKCICNQFWGCANNSVRGIRVLELKMILTICSYDFIILWKLISHFLLHILLNAALLNEMNVRILYFLQSLRRHLEISR